MLFEEGRLLMDEPIATYLPELADRRVVVDRNDPSRTVAAIQQPTVQHLLQHTAGFTAAAGGDTALHRLYPYQGRDTPRTFTGAEFLARLRKILDYSSPCSFGIAFLYYWTRRRVCRPRVCPSLLRAADSMTKDKTRKELSQRLDGLSDREVFMKSFAENLAVPPTNHSMS